MSIQKPSIPKGTRDFSPAEMVRRNYIFDTVKEVFKKYGYLPLETPAMEYLETLLGKYGEEGDKLLFKILNSGDFMQGVQPNGNVNTLSLKICEKGLRYDLTVPFARYVVQHQHEIIFPFKRYQIQPVWRADRPQKGRYREFYQCDADVIGSPSLLNETELIQIMDEVFGKLAIRVTIKMNNRKILSGISEYIGEAEKITDITVAIDKLEKIGEEKLFAELLEKGLSREAVRKIQPLLKITGSGREKLAVLAPILSGTASGSKGIEELQAIFDSLDDIPASNPIEFDIALARGLNYYTGAIFEVKATDAEIGSICGGGRYDDLTGIFGLPGISGVGISFGADRIYDVMNQLCLFPLETEATTEVLVANFGVKEAGFCLLLCRKLREAGIRTEMYPDAVKLGKQIGYASSRKIPFVALVGENEIREGKITLKRLSDGEQQALSLDDLIRYLKK